jgi:long-subunit fatty acid transport protein
MFLGIPQVEASLFENMAVDPVAISLANSVTAYPPGTASIHYNPAGLSLMSDGNYISQGGILAVENMKNRFEKDPNFEEFHDFKGNVIHDPLAGREGANTSGRMYLPIIDITLDLPAMLGPVTGFSFREPGSKWTFAYAMYAPMAAGWVNGDSDTPSRYEVKSMYLQHLIYLGPGVSYRVNKNLAIGLALGLGQTAMGQESSMRAPNEMTNITKTLGDATQGMSNPVFDILGVPMPLFGGGLGPYADIGNLSLKMRDDFSPSYNLGMLWEPYDWITFGLSYNSAISSHMTGKFSFKYSQDWQNMTYWMGQNAIMQIVSMVFDMPYQSVAEQSGTVTMDMEFPQMVNFGIKFKPIKRLSLMGDLRWAQWSVTKEYKITFDQKLQVLQLSKFMGYNGGAYTIIMAKNWNDTLNWSVGVEYQALDWLALRAGYENRVSPCIAETYDLMSMPTTDFYGAGLGIKGNALGWEMTKDADIDLSLGYMINNGYTIYDGISQNLNSTQLGQGVNNPYRGLNYVSSIAVYMAGLKITMPLEVFTDDLYKKLSYVIPSRWQKHPKAKKDSLKASEAPGKPVDSSSAIINNLRPEGKSYYIEDSE